MYTYKYILYWCLYFHTGTDSEADDSEANNSEADSEADLSLDPDTLFCGKNEYVHFSLYKYNHNYVLQNFLFVGKHYL